MTTSRISILDQRVRTCSMCSLCDTRSNAVVGSGPHNASVLLLGEAPGANEDRTGLPFQGLSGKILTEALSQANLDRLSVRISNVVRCRPPGNRPPTPAEMDSCKSHLIEEIEALSPKIIVTLGASPARALGILKQREPLSSVRGSVFDLSIDASTYRVLATVHPAYALRSRVKVLPVLVADLKRASDLSLGGN